MAEQSSASPIRPKIEIRPEWLTPSDRYAWLAIARNVLPLFVLFALLPILADWSLFLPWLLCPAVGLLIYRVSLVMHDCVHLSLFKHRPFNTRVGVTLGAMIGIDFHAFAKQHRLHHQSYGTEIDPQGFHYLDLAQKSQKQLQWHYLRGLLGFNLRHTLSESVAEPHNLKRLITSKEIITVIILQGFILLLVTGAGRHLSLALIPIISSATFGLFFSQLRGMAEHGVANGTAAVGYVRSHRRHWLDLLLLHDVNFNYHREHHLYPQCPSVHLPEIHAAEITNLTIDTLSSNSPNLNASMFSTLTTLYAKAKSQHE